MFIVQVLGILFQFFGLSRFWTCCFQQGEKEELGQLQSWLNEVSSTTNEWEMLLCLHECWGWQHWWDCEAGSAKSLWILVETLTKFQGYFWNLNMASMSSFCIRFWVSLLEFSHGPGSKYPRTHEALWELVVASVDSEWAVFKKRYWTLHTKPYWQRAPSRTELYVPLLDS